MTTPVKVNQALISRMVLHRFNSPWSARSYASKAFMHLLTSVFHLLLRCDGEKRIGLRFKIARQPDHQHVLAECNVGRHRHVDLI